MTRAAEAGATTARGAGSTGWFEGGQHVYPLRVYHEDTDAGGIVYYANYLKFAERARTEMMRAANIAHGALRDESGVAFIVRRCVADYRAPALLDDAIQVRTTIGKVAGAHIDADQHVVRGGDLLVALGLKLGCVDRRGRAVRLPASVRGALSRLERADRH